MDFCIDDAEIERGRAMMARSYVPTEKLAALRSRDPELAKVIEDMCNVIRAASGFVMTSGACNVLERCNKAIEPWIDVPSSDVPAMAGLAELFAIAKSAAKKPAQIIRRTYEKPGPKAQKLGSFVTFAKDRNKWKAFVRASGKSHYVGIYATEEEARAASTAAMEQFCSPAPRNFGVRV